MGTVDTPDLERMAVQLESSGQYKILRRPPPFAGAPVDVQGLRRGVVVDVETTGVHFPQDEILQLALLGFYFDDDGTIHGADAPFSGLNDAIMPIPPAITTLTGISREQVEGQSIDGREVEDYVGRAEIVVAHHAGFDRKFVERDFSVFRDLPWGCSLNAPDWTGAGFDGQRLAWLLMRMGMFHESHRADADVVATLAVLAHRLPSTGRTALHAVLSDVRIPKVRIWAVGAAFFAKDVLRSRGYAWNSGDDGRARAWFRDVPSHAREEEVRFLEGFLPLRKAKDAKSFIATCADLRFWPREMKVNLDAASVR